METRRSVQPSVIVASLSMGLVGLALFVSLVVAALGGRAIVGEFLYGGLSWAAFLVPAYPWAGALILALPGFRPDLLVGLVVSLAPFASLAATARLLDDFARASGMYPLVDRLGAMGTAALGLGVTLALAAACMFSVAKTAAAWGRPGLEDGDGARPEAEADEDRSFPGAGPKLEFGMPANPMAALLSASPGSGLGTGASGEAPGSMEPSGLAEPSDAELDSAAGLKPAAAGSSGEGPGALSAASGAVGAAPSTDSGHAECQAEALADQALPENAKPPAGPVPAEPTSSAEAASSRAWPEYGGAAAEAEDVGFFEEAGDDEHERPHIVAPSQAAAHSIDSSTGGPAAADEPIPLMFGRRAEAKARAQAEPGSRAESLPGVGEAARAGADPAGAPGRAALAASDPALDEGFWDDDEADSDRCLDTGSAAGECAGEAALFQAATTAAAGAAGAAASGSARASLLPKVETFFDGEHDEAVRDGSGASATDTPAKRKAAASNAAAANQPVAAPPRKPGRKPIVKYELPVEGILTAYPDGQYWIIDDKTRLAADVLRETLKEFGIAAEVTGIRKGPVITMFEILPAPGVRLSKIANLSDNIALRLAASSVRIVAPIPGKHAVGIEVPNERRSIVSFREIVENDGFKNAKMEVPVVLGKDITGEVQVAELTQTPHLLIAGATGSGKSVCVNSIILSILYKRSFNEVKLILIDPKIVELKLYNGVPHLLTPVITEPKRAFQALQYCICEMERRYSLLDSMGVRDIKSYNRKIVDKAMATDKLPYIVVVIDEFADLMATTGKELESTLARLAAMSRAVGIHLVLATQRPSIDVITGLIKANIPSRIAFMVASKFDSRIIIDMVGAEKLLGRGDMLYSSATDAFPVRMQGAFVSEDEVERVVAHVKTLGEPDYIDDEIFVDDEDEDDGPSLFDEEDDDPLYEKALEIVLAQGKASASYLQRKLKIGYNRAARLVELMEEKGIVGKAQGSKPRDLVHNPDYGRAPNPRARYVPDFGGDEESGDDVDDGGPAGGIEDPIAYADEDSA